MLAAKDQAPFLESKERRSRARFSRKRDSFTNNLMPTDWPVTGNRQKATWWDFQLEKITTQHPRGMGGLDQSCQVALFKAKYDKFQFQIFNFVKRLASKFMFHLTICMKLQANTVREWNSDCKVWRTPLQYIASKFVRVVGLFSKSSRKVSLVKPKIWPFLKQSGLFQLQVPGNPGLDQSSPRYTVTSPLGDLHIDFPPWGGVGEEYFLLCSFVLDGVAQWKK